ncbi:P-loop containing nucleoside triphosphate hydrolase protein [Boletus reticuloceps]|uniref:P-loop containing nucleoside triphosphate hydrolase protein n=1 Tax=Boletus reticuloceps TaxID=495285 RepID=A0A8I2YU74_9AGAM|nr:P-loop containing nucleoside triphosphate hydrolase protein [Boletus reticuloceps]
MSSSPSNTPDGKDAGLDAPPPVGLTQLFRYATPLELFLNAIGLVAAAAAGAAQPLMSLIFGRLTQDFVSFGTAEAAYYQQTNNATALQELQVAAAQFRSTAALDASYLVYIGIGTLVCTFTYTVIWVYTGEVNAKRIRERYLQAILRQDIAYFDSVGAGEVATRIQTDTHLVQQGISEKVPLAVSFISAFITGFVLAYARSWRLALAMSAVLPCIGITGALMNKFVSKLVQASLKHVADGGTLAEEVISSVRTTHAFGTQKTLTTLYDTHIQRASIVDAKAAIYNGAAFGAFFFILYSAYALAFQFGTTLINQGYGKFRDLPPSIASSSLTFLPTANAGDVVNVLLAILIGSFSLALLAPEMQAVTNGRGAAAKLFATIERVPAIDSSDPSGLKPDEVVGEISLEDVRFNYPSRPDVPIVKGINITFTAGKTAALVGASGSGKSTIISLIERFYDPLSGSVQLDGVDIRHLNIKWLRSQIGLVSQEPTLFATSVRGNVAHGLINTPYEHLPEEDKFKLIKEACIKANADGFISKLPNGYDTLVGERGFLMSGGQKQRIAIARAIVSDPRILLLDEATSALDTQSEGIVQDALDKASAGRTTITIAHRLSTIKDADCIYVMGEGLVFEMGTHTELLADENSAYSRLVNAQKLRETKEVEDSVSTAAVSVEVDAEKDVEEELSLARKGTIQSVASDLAKQRNDERKHKEVDENNYSMFYLFARIGLLNREGLWRYAAGSFCAMMTGMVYPLFGIIFGEFPCFDPWSHTHIPLGRAISGFSEPDPSVRRYDGNRNGLWFFIIAILSGFAICFQTYFFTSTAAALTSKMRSASFKAILRQDSRFSLLCVLLLVYIVLLTVEYFDKDEHSTGSLTASLSENPQKINGLAGVTLGTIVQSLTTLIGGSIIGLVFAWKPALVGMACIPFLISTGYIRLRVVVLKDQQNKRAHESSAHLACEAAASIRTVASLTREEDCLRLYSESLDGPLRNSNRTTKWSSLLYAFSQSITFYVIALVFWYGARLVSYLELSTMAFFVSLMSTTFGAIQAGNIFAFVPDISSARSAAAAIVKLIDSTPEIDAESTAGKTFEAEKVRGQIRFENIHFRYPTRPGVPVLRDLSFKVEPGTYVALVGASGCGKSTVIQMMERFYDPLSGQILLDGQPINEFSVQEYRKEIALVSQEPTLYAGTVQFNILLGATKPESEVTQEEIEAACRDANILDFIRSLPDGFDTQVGGKGSQLSGGQKQRIAIARALLRNPKVLLLDEATSALDSNSEKVVQEALDQAAKGRTTIAIAHRLSTIQNADCIYFIKEGRVSEAGTHDELLSLRGGYYEYVQLQALSTK